MSENICDEKFCTDSKNLAVAVYGFLLNERRKKRHVEKARLGIDKATDCLEKVFKFSLVDHANLSIIQPLEDIFATGLHPIPIKNRIDAECHKLRGDSFLETKMFKLAEEEYTEAIHLHPKNAIYYCNRAAARLGQRLFDDAVQDCHKALELDKNYAKAYCWLGLANVLMDNPALAMRYYRKALKIEPDNPVCIANMNLIGKFLHRPAFRVYGPLVRWSRSLIATAANTANNQTALRKNSSGDYIDTEVSDKNGHL